MSLAMGHAVFIGRGVKVVVLEIDRHGRIQIGVVAPPGVAVSRAGRGLDYHLERQLARERGATGTAPVDGG
jgi:sRNA-binding carbon storage regulator CsrA